MNDRLLELREFLGTIQLWRGLPAEQLDALARMAIVQTYQKGEIIFLQGDEGRGFFAIVSGKVKIFKASAEGKEQILELFGPTEHFAEVPVFDGGCFPASAVALEKTELLFFPRTLFLELLQQHPTLAVNMLAVFARHLRHFARLIEDLSLKEIPGRLAAYLLYLSDRPSTAEPHSHSTSSIVELEMTKSQLAAFLGTIPETLSRVFAKLSQDQLISMDGAKITLLNRERLTSLAAGKKLSSQPPQVNSQS